MRGAVSVLKVGVRGILTFILKWPPGLRMNPAFRAGSILGG